MSISKGWLVKPEKKADILFEDIIINKGTIYYKLL